MTTHPAEPAVPRIVGDWWHVVTLPKLEKYDKPGIQAVDFTIYQAADRTWQLVSCLRHTGFPGKTRLLYRWETKNLYAGQRLEFSQRGKPVRSPPERMVLPVGTDERSRVA